MSTHVFVRRGLIGTLVAGLVAAPLSLGLAAPAQAVPSTSLVIAEFYGNGGNANAVRNADFVELQNLGSAPIDLSSYSIQYRSASGVASAAGTAPLSGTIAAGGRFLVRLSATTANGAGLPTPDYVATGVNAGGTNGQIYLVNGTTGINPGGAGNINNPAVVDFLGFGTAVSFETAAATGVSDNTKSFTRSDLTVDGDNNSTDFAATTPTPRNAAGETEPPAATTPTIAPITPKTGTVDSAITTFTATASGGVQPYAWNAGGTLPPGVSINGTTGVVSGTPTSAGVYDVVLTVTDATTPTATTDTEAFTFTVDAAPTGVTPIAEIQGTGAATPLASAVTTEGVVTAAYPTGGLNGFYIQTPGPDTDNASDAVFVYGGVNGFTTYPAVGDSVRVTGTPGEFQTATQLTSTDAQVTQIAALGTVTPKTQIPGADCVLPGTSCLTLAQLDTAREPVEGELFQPAGSYTATDVYDFGPAYNSGSNGTVNRGEIALAANSTKPLVAPTEIIDAQATALKNERIAYNLAHRILLDDASSNTYSTTANSDQPFPWVTETYATRVGAAVTFPSPVVLTQGFEGSWRLLPTSQVVGQPSASQPQFEQTRAANAAPQPVGGDIKLATFNVLNFFPTTGNEFVSSGLGTCTYFTDRAGAQISNNSCNPNGPRGAANQENLARQRAKIVAAINTSGADVVSLEELENSVKFGKNRDFAINALVTALNAAAGPGTWSAVPSPAAAELPALADQDVIRNGFIYKASKVALVGPSDVLQELSTGTDVFSDAREPLAQAFKKVGTSDDSAFGVIVNHFKSKGSGDADPDGQGNATNRRVLQANALVTFADQFKTARNISRIFLAGDFNAYSQEDPIQVLTAAGYTNLDSTSNPDEETYNFDGQVGSLDHVLANAAALADVNAVDIWEINGNESVFYEYARFNTNITNLYAPNAFRSSDHSPEIVGINVGAPVVTRDIQILATNDFHGRLLNNQAGAPGSPTGTPAGPNTSADTQAGAAVLSGAVKQFRGENPDTVFAAAGDLIGASTFESFIQNDNPTIDALNAAGLEVSAAGNHEFDQGYEDLVGRVQDRADWEYIAANVEEPSGRDDLAESWTKDFDGVTVGFVGAVTEDLPSLVSPSGIQGVTVTDIVDATNAEAEALKDAGADLIVLLVHEGSPSTDCATMTDPSTAWGNIVVNTSANVDAIVSGHTHLAYNCSFPVTGKTFERPVVSAGQYGTNLNKLVFTVDATSGAPLAKTQALVPLKSSTTPFAPLFEADPAVTPIVAEAITAAAGPGAAVVGKIAAPFSRAKFSNGVENRGGESTLGNLVAEIQRWATSDAASGSAQIAFMNPGGLRGDLAGTPAQDGGRTITYRDAANVQPFANGLVNMSLTGAQIETVLEQQWQTTAAGTVPTRPFLKLGQSNGFEYTYYTYPAASGPARTVGEVTSMQLNGVELVPTQTYSVTVNSFLASGGDNFREFNNGLGKRQNGKSDLQAQVEYFRDVVGTTTPLPVDYSQRAVGATFPDQTDTTYQPGETVTFDLSSLIMTGSAGGVVDLKDSVVEVRLGSEALGTYPVDQTVPTVGTGTGQADPFSTDEFGTATVTFPLPAGAASGVQNLTITGPTTGTEVQVPITVERLATTITGVATPVAAGQDSTVTVTVDATDSDEVPTGEAQVLDGDTVVGSVTLVEGSGQVVVPASELTPGDNVFTLRYLGQGSFESSTGSVTVTVTEAPTPPLATPAITVRHTPAKVVVDKTRPQLVVVVRSAGEPATGWVQVRVAGKTYIRRLVDGRLTLRLPVFKTTGVKTVFVKYGGDSTTKARTASHTIRVVKR